MSWDDFGFYGGGDSGGGDFTTGSYTPSDYSGFSLGGDFNYQPPSAGLGGPGNQLDTSGINGGLSQSGAGNFSPQLSAGPMGAPGAAAPGGLGSWLGQPQNALGLGGGLAGLLGTIMNGGKGATSQPVLPTAAKAQIGQANQITQPGATGQLPLQQMQMSLLQSLANGQGLPPGYQQLVEQAFQPQMGDLYTQAANMGAARGFHDAPATSPPGGAILGPGLANLQGQMAQAKLGLMQSLPGLYNTPVQTQIGAAGQQSNALLNSANMEKGQTQSQPMGGQVMNTIGAGLQGLGQSMGQQQKDQQAQQNFDKMISMSGAPRAFAQGGIVTQPTNAIIGEAGPEAVIPLGGQRPQMPQPMAQPPQQGIDLMKLFHLLGLLQAPDRQQMLGSR